MTRFHRWPALMGALLLALILFPLLVDGRTREVVWEGPWQTGDAFHYDLYWTVFKVGEATLQLDGMVDFKGRPAMKASFRVRTSGWVNRLYKVRNEATTWMTPDLSHSLGYTKEQREGDHRRDVVVDLTWPEGIAQYTNFGEPREPVAIPPGTQDPLSILIKVAARDLVPGTDLHEPVTDGKKLVEAVVAVAEEETLEVNAGTFPTIKLVPDVKDLGGVFKKSDDASLEIWYARDSRIPVMLKSRVVVGSFHGELARITRKGETWLPPEATPPAEEEEESSANRSRARR